ncbi:hypothetical protein BJX61DRAFT_498172 [Aspergillus egyptiacus]|nr:hypothetical protein BJX61DRAFT_498172 [Aspergillus egyptiacus]
MLHTLGTAVEVQLLVQGAWGNGPRCWRPFRRIVVPQVGVEALNVGTRSSASPWDAILFDGDLTSTCLLGCRVNTTKQRASTSILTL